MANALKPNASLPSTVNFQENEQNKMEGDDSHLVDEILNELNDGVNPNDAQQMGNIDPQLQMDPQMMMNQQMDQSVGELPPVQNISYETEDSKLSSIFEQLKKPLLITCLAFIIMNPIFFKLLSDNIPQIFGSTDNVFLKQGRTLILALLIGILYFASNLLM